MKKITFLLIAGVLLISSSFLLEEKKFKTVKFNASDGLEITADLYINNIPESPFIILFHQHRLVSRNLVIWNQTMYRMEIKIIINVVVNNINDPASLYENRAP